jgi:hypothetical protein
MSTDPAAPVLVRHALLADRARPPPRRRMSAPLGATRRAVISAVGQYRHVIEDRHRRPAHPVLALPPPAAAMIHIVELHAAPKPPIELRGTKATR